MEAIDLFTEVPEQFHPLEKMIESKDSSTGLWSVTFETILQDFKPTSNNRFYSKPLMEAGINIIHDKCISANHMYGEWDHPINDIAMARSDSDAFKRFISILWEKVSHQFLEVRIDGPYIIGKIKTLHTKFGRQMTDLIVLDKASLGFSLRSAGKGIKNRQGILDVQSDRFTIITWDCVVNPACNDAKYTMGNTNNTNPNNNYQSNMLGESTEIIQSSNDIKCINGVCGIIQQNPKMLFENNNSHVGEQFLNTRVSEIVSSIVY